MTMAEEVQTVLDPVDPPVAEPAASDPPADPPANDPPAADPPKVSAAWAPGEREALASTIADEKERAKFLERLNRFPSKAEMAKTIREQDKLFASGKVKPALSEKPTETELAQYRKDNGIPETPDKYLDALKLEDGLVIGDDDKPLLEIALKAAHAENLTPRQVSAMVNAKYKADEQAAADFVINQTRLKQQTTDALNQEWGAEYRPTINSIANLISTAPNGVGEMLGKAVLPNGDVALNNIDVLRWFATLSRQVNPTGVVPRGDGGNINQSVDEELASFAKMRKENLAGWHKNLTAKARERELLEWKEKQGRAA
jgi:hypothetical protein